MPPKTSHLHHPHPHLTIHPHHLLRSRRCLRRPHLLRKLLWISFQIPAGRHHHHLHLRNRTCRWLTSHLLRRSSSMQALSLALWSLAALRLLFPQLLACPRLLRQLLQLHLLQLVLGQNLWPGSHRRTQWARPVGLPGRILAHLWSHPRSCRWSGFALWVLPQGFQTLLRVHRPLRSLCEEPCLVAPAQ